MADDKSTKIRPELRKVLAKAATSYLNIAVVGSAAVGAAALQSLPLLALGGAAYAALVAWDCVSPSFWKKALATEATKLPDPDSIKEAATKQVVEGIVAAQTELEKVLEETPADVKVHLGMVLASVAEMEQRAVSLIARSEDLAQYLARVDPEPVRRDLARLADRARGARDAEAKAEFESARKAREEQLHALEDIAGAKERLHANLSRIEATLAGLPPKVVRMRVLDAQAMDALTGDLNGELEQVNGEIQSFEDALKQMMEIAK